MIFAETLLFPFGMKLLAWLGWLQSFFKEDERIELDINI
jgi:hypothetical protein